MSVPSFILPFPSWAALMLFPGFSYYDRTHHDGSSPSTVSSWLPASPPAPSVVSAASSRLTSSHQWIACHFPGSHLLSPAHSGSVIWNSCWLRVGRSISVFQQHLKQSVYTTLVLVNVPWPHHTSCHFWFSRNCQPRLKLPRPLALSLPGSQHLVIKCHWSLFSLWSAGFNWVWLSAWLYAECWRRQPKSWEQEKYGHIIPVADFTASPRDRTCGNPSSMALRGSPV